MRSADETNAINRVLKARGLPSLDHPEVLAYFGSLVQDHTHFTELLRACEPGLRRDMYEAMRPHLRFAAWPLDQYVATAKEEAQAKELPTIDQNGDLHPYSMPVIEVELEPFELHVLCSFCDREGFFHGDREADSVHELRNAGWSWDTFNRTAICANCLGESDVTEIK